MSGHPALAAAEFVIVVCLVIAAPVGVWVWHVVRRVLGKRP